MRLLKSAVALAALSAFTGLANATTVTTGDSSSTAGNLVCEAGAGGTTITDCGVSPWTSFPANSIAGNNTGSPAAPTAIAVSGTFGKVLLSRGTGSSQPKITDGQLEINNSDTTANQPVLTISNTITGTNGENADQINFICNNASGVGKYCGEILSVLDTATNGAEYSHNRLSAIENGVVGWEASWGNGFCVGNGAAGCTRNGIGTLTTQKGIFPGQTTVAGLPTCNGAAKGSFWVVTDSNSTTFNSVLAGGGTNVHFALCDGANWRLH